MPRQGSTLLICDLQAKLNGPWPAGIGDCPEATGKRSAAFPSTREGPAHWRKWSAKRCRESTRCGVDVAVENVKKLCSEVDGCVFSEETRLLAQGQSARDCERIRVPERSCGGFEVRTLIRLVYSGNNVYTGDPGEVTPGE